MGKDEAEILGYERETKAIIDRVDSEDRFMLDNKTQSQFGIELGQRGGWLINESGMYSLILSSKLPTAKKFKHWVTSEVLPAIRKYGMYAIDDLIADLDLGIAALNALKEEREKNKKLAQSVAVQAQQISEMVPKASYYDVVLNCKDLVSISTISKDYGWSGAEPAQANFELEPDQDFNIFSSRFKNVLKNGYTSTKTHTYLDDGGQHTKVHTYWTQKGRLFIYDLLKEDGIYPNIEKLAG